MTPAHGKGGGRPACRVSSFFGKVCQILWDEVNPFNSTSLSLIGELFADQLDGGDFERVKASNEEMQQSTCGGSALSSGDTSLTANCLMKQQF